MFTPPFDHMSHDPGYIKGYPPGIRENGGQYTHAAAWSVIAFALLGEGGKATALFALLNPINHVRTRAELRHYKAVRGHSPSPFCPHANKGRQPKRLFPGGGFGSVRWDIARSASPPGRVDRRRPRS
ncbi:hypothetical protein [Mesorhizobium sp. M7D.F.Ca.US.005.01.1.1]|uniref:GH36-type glycosyl hydrolase domain-containing protein n=1 Tax=Mesorhizobium sp. M7D.F.Ca.US.005.01.1.1 TaxID=2493678 RepID=UPI0024797AF0|nr:hypothetical protein [Mesorhizobium sp. M7D.F.Ca.US.005.01.1.1]